MTVDVPARRGDCVGDTRDTDARAGSNPGNVSKEITDTRTHEYARECGVAARVVDGYLEDVAVANLPANESFAITSLRRGQTRRDPATRHRDARVNATKPCVRME